MNPQDYEVRIRPLSEDDGRGFFAKVPELPGCMSGGETPQEALENVYDAIGWIGGPGRWEGQCRRRGGWQLEARSMEEPASAA